MAESKVSGATGTPDDAGVRATDAGDSTTESKSTGSTARRRSRPRRSTAASRKGARKDASTSHAAPPSTGARKWRARKRTESVVSAAPPSPATPAAEDRARVSASRTILVPAGVLFSAWQDTRYRRRWLGDGDFIVRAAVPGRSLSIAWEDGSPVEVQFHARGVERTQVTIEQVAPDNAGEVARLKERWKERLGRLKEVLES